MKNIWHPQEQEVSERKLTPVNNSKSDESRAAILNLKRTVGTMTLKENNSKKIINPEDTKQNQTSAAEPETFMTWFSVSLVIFSHDAYCQSPPSDWLRTPWLFGNDLTYGGQRPSVEVSAESGQISGYVDSENLLKAELV